MLYAHNDKSSWGANFVMSARYLGVAAELFDHHEEVPDNAKAFVRLSQQLHEYDLCISTIKALHERGVQTLPTYSESVLYDSKINQLHVLSDYMPHTAHLTDVEGALSFAEAVGYPLISKASQGASSKNVRLIESKTDLQYEAWAILKGEGFPISYGRKQKDYLLLQQLIPNNDCDYRIVICGRFAFGLIRYVRPDVPFASGSGNNTPITKWEGRAAKALLFCHDIHRRVLKSDWMCYDVVFGENDAPYLLEVSSAWKAESYQDCTTLVLQDDVWIDGDYTGRDMFKFAVEVLHGEDLL